MTDVQTARCEKADGEHIKTCLIPTEKTRRLENEFQLGPPEKLARIAALTAKYAAATSQEQEKLWVCSACYHFGEAEKVPVVCLYCGIAFTMPASEFMEKLGR